MDKKGESSIWTVTTLVVLGILAALFLLPTAGVLLSSLKSNQEISSGELWKLPSSLYFENYREILQNPRIYQYLFNTLLVTSAATILSIILGVLAGYVFSTLPFPGAHFLFLLIVSGMFFPPQVVLIPLFRLFREINLLDTLWSLIIVHTAMGIPICTLLIRNFLSTIPSDLREAAIIDGAKEWQILLKVILPISLPALAVLATLQFTWIWNDFLWPLVFIQSDSKRTIMLGLVALKGQYSVAWGTQGALSLIASLPTLIIFLFFQRYFVKGMTLGAVKG